MTASRRMDGWGRVDGEVKGKRRQGGWQRKQPSCHRNKAWTHFFRLNISILCLKESSPSSTQKCLNLHTNSTASIRKIQAHSCPLVALSEISNVVEECVQPEECTHSKHRQRDENVTSSRKKQKMSGLFLWQQQGWAIKAQENILLFHKLCRRAVQEGLSGTASWHKIGKVFTYWKKWVNTSILSTELSAVVVSFHVRTEQLRHHILAGSLLTCPQGFATQDVF